MTKIRYLSLFSGIEAFSCAVKDMPEFEPVAFAEIEPFPCAVLQHHFPDVPNLGDVTQIDGRELRGHVDLIVGGSPCQGFSVAGQRKGLNDERSCLALAYVRLVEEVRPKWILWENVPGVFSTNGGQDFRSFCAALDNLRYSLSWSVLDSQYWGVAQRRRRVFLVGVAGTDWERCAKVLLEPESMCGNPPPRRKKGEGNSNRTEGGAGERGKQGNVAQNPTFATLCASGAGCDRPSAQGSQLDYCVVDEQPNELAPSLTSSGAAFSRTGQHGTEVDALVLDTPAYAVRTAQTGANGIGIDEETAHTLDSSGTEAVAFAQNQRDEVRQMDVVGALAAEPGMRQTTYVAQEGVYPIDMKSFHKDKGGRGLGLGAKDDPAFCLRTDHPPAVAFKKKTIVQPLDVAGTLVNSRSGLSCPGRNSLDFLVLEQETIADETAGALLSRDAKGLSSTIDGKLVAVKTSLER